MKTVTIMRHAKSSWGEPGVDDFERGLNDRGRNAARTVGRELDRRGARFDCVLASPAVRVRETLDELMRGYGTQLEVRFDPQLYAANALTWEILLRALPEKVESPLLVGHNPVLQQLVLALTSDDGEALRQQVAAKFPTAALAFVDMPAKRWKDVERGRGRIRDLILPRELD